MDLYLEKIYSLWNISYLNKRYQKNNHIILYQFNRPYPVQQYNKKYYNKIILT